MTIRYLSAGDRINYGDFLFSLIFREYFHEHFNIVYYGIERSDYSYFGALPTKSYANLIEEVDINKDVIIVGGGEVFFPRWKLLYSFIKPTLSRITKNRLLNKLDELLKFSKIFFFHTKDDFPFVPNLNCKTIFVCAGGGFDKLISDNEVLYLRNLLIESPFLAVRDNRTHDSLKKNGIPSRKVPDSAVLMSKVYSIDSLSDKITNKDLQKIEARFIFLQIGNLVGPENLVDFVSEINKLANDLNSKVICCPIGMAFGHEDQLILKKLCDLDPTWQLIIPRNIFEIMYLIAKSEIYMGTSLHGLITAFSFLRPAITFNTIISKTSSFTDTWCPGFYGKTIDYENIYRNSKDILSHWDGEELHKKLFVSQRLVEKYFIEIKEYLNTKINNATK